jgi:hypothetical protein
MLFVYTFFITQLMSSWYSIVFWIPLQNRVMIQFSLQLCHFAREFDVQGFILFLKFCKIQVTISEITESQITFLILHKKVEIYQISFRANRTNNNFHIGHL